MSLNKILDETRKFIHDDDVTGDEEIFVVIANIRTELTTVFRGLRNAERREQSPTFVMEFRAMMATVEAILR